MDYVALKAELVTDPAARGYGAFPVQGGQTQEQFDAVQVAYDYRAAGLLSDLIRPGEIKTLSRGTLLDCVLANSATEYLALTGGLKTRVDLILNGSGDVDISTGTNVRSTLLAAFANNGATRNRFLALVAKLQSRTAELGFPDVTVSDVSIARRT